MTTKLEICDRLIELTSAHYERMAQFKAAKNNLYQLQSFLVERKRNLTQLEYQLSILESEFKYLNSYRTLWTNPEFIEDCSFAENIKNVLKLENNSKSILFSDDSNSMVVKADSFLENNVSKADSYLNYMPMSSDCKNGSISIEKIQQNENDRKDFYSKGNTNYMESNCDKETTPMNKSSEIEIPSIGKIYEETNELSPKKSSLDLTLNSTNSNTLLCLSNIIYTENVQMSEVENTNPVNGCIDSTTTKTPTLDNGNYDGIKSYLQTLLVAKTNLLSEINELEKKKSSLLEMSLRDRQEWLTYKQSLGQICKLIGSFTSSGTDIQHATSKRASLKKGESSSK